MPASEYKQNGVPRGKSKAVKFGIRMDKCTSNGNAVDDREILFCFSLLVVLN